MSQKKLIDELRRDWVHSVWYGPRLIDEFKVKKPASLLYRDLIKSLIKDFYP